VVRACFLFALTLVAVDALAEEPSKFHGKITLTRTGAWQHKIPDSEKVKVLGSGDKINLTDKATIKFCLKDGKVQIGQAWREFTLEGTVNSTVTEVQAKCIDEKDPKKVETKKPGHSRSTESKITFEDLSGREEQYKDILKNTNVVFSPMTMSGMETAEQYMKVLSGGPLQKGRHTLGGGITSPIMVHGFLRTTFEDVCDDKKMSTFIRWWPLKRGSEPEYKVDSLDPVSSSCQVFIPIEDWELQAFWEIDFDPQGCGNTETILDEDGQKLTAQWSLTPADPCKDLPEQIEHDLSYAKAFADSDLQQEDRDSYLCLVDQRAIKYWTGKDKDLKCRQAQSGASTGASTDLGVNQDCQIVNDEEYREQQEKLCRPPAETDGVMHHEHTHQKQCRDNPSVYTAANTSNSAKSYIEVEAHLAGVEHMLDWMEENCPKSDTKKYRDQIKAIREALKSNPWSSSAGGR
jgi:hypothetical protein